MHNEVWGCAETLPRLEMQVTCKQELLELYKFV